MKKEELLRGMKLARMVNDNLSDKKYVLRREFNTDTTVSSGVQIAIGDSQPLDKSFWFDTSDYASIQGSIETFTLTAENFDSAVEVGNTQPTAENILWFDTSDNSAGD